MKQWEYEIVIFFKLFTEYFYHLFFSPLLVIDGRLYSKEEVLMNKGYLMAHLRVYDKEAFEKLRQMAGPTIAEYGGKV